MIYTEALFQMFIPDGNNTALVFLQEDTLSKRTIIQELILTQYPQLHIEQVGFVTGDSEVAFLCMTGQEFCLNAVRCVAWYFLHGRPGELMVYVSGIGCAVRAGITDQLEVWSEVPVDPDLKKIRLIEPEVYLVNLSTITHLVVTKSRTQRFLCANTSLYDGAEMLLEKYKLRKQPAAGVMFLESAEPSVRLHPYVYVKATQTMLYETACGSGTMAAGLVMAAENRNNMEKWFIQPSQQRLRALVQIEYPYIKRACVIGTVKSDGIVNRIEIK